MASDQATFQTDITISTDAEIGISERGPQEENGGYNSTNLVETEHEGELSIGIDEDCADGEIYLRLSSYHIENQESGRAFHSSARVYLSPDQVNRLVHFLNYLKAINNAQ